MARHRQSRDNVEIWPGFVDALSTLLLSVIFLLVVFVLGQFFLGQLLQGRNQTVQQLESRVQDLGSQLQLEQDSAAELRRTLARLNADLQTAFVQRDDVQGRLAQTDAERDRLGEQLATLTDEQARLQQALDSVRSEAQAARARGEDLERTLAETRRSVQADQATIELQLGQLVQLRQDIETLRKVRQELEGRVATLADAEARTKEERNRLLAELGSIRNRASQLEARLADADQKTMLAQKELEQRDLRLAELERTAASLPTETSAKEAAIDRVRVLTEQIRTLSTQLASLGQALDLKQQEIDQQSSTIANLGQRLNVALASKVEELSQYRSEFFGRLRATLGLREDVRIVGDRFVFQSEVLFASGSDFDQPARPSPARRARGHAQGHRRRDPDRPRLGAAGRRPYRPAPDQHRPLPLELGALDRPRHRRRPLPGQPGYPRRTGGRAGFRRVPAPRPRPERGRLPS